MTDVFAGRSTLIFGGGKGIGRAVAQEFALRGARVAVADIDIAEAEKTAQVILEGGGQAKALRCDVTSDASIRETAETAEAAFGPVGIVMNNVGGILHGNPEDIPVSEWQRIIDLNLMPVVRSNAVFLPKMLARGSGFIVNTASFAGLYPFAATRMPYVSAKAGVIALSESLALYLEPLGIRVSCLIPGPVMTGVMDAMKTWTEGLEMRGPGSDLDLITVEDCARTLANGMEAGKILIPSHEEAWTTLARHAADPDRFIRDKIAEVAAGDYGKPRISEAMLAAIKARAG
ncbi:SDR family NAD(P)-dependent oxidoreductase [Novosphingobium album (ex Hu et al. 2023)]|uniref:SDR family oxidoreductase n=1 Tax=Novosphingobium album (ex Hu et al. 2023) TaxID=2930093 RepID=A0ABT0B2R0_9SPHN|nr:SDR family oxidoreductase [Novosphingobium album (ex Hu et al. 2023)]MCJ2179329.1 SDR family oxidoreductase [Novosphingobium album (ex Hu et al. 2023)]